MGYFLLPGGRAPKRSHTAGRSLAHADRRVEAFVVPGGGLFFVRRSAFWRTRSTSPAVSFARVPACWSPGFQSHNSGSRAAWNRILGPSAYTSWTLTPMQGAEVPTSARTRPRTVFRTFGYPSPWVRALAASDGQARAGRWSS